MKKTPKSSIFNKDRIEVSSKCHHPIACVLEHVHTQTAWVAVAGIALQTHVGLLPRVSPHVDLQVTILTEALCALVTLEGLLPE